MYKTIAFFTDLQDNGHPYEVGDVYPREGLEPSPERISELSGPYNLRKTPLIAEVEQPKTPAAKKPVKKSTKK